MNLRRDATRAWGLLLTHSPKWLAVRLLLELYKRSGQEAHAYPPRPWREDEWRGWVGPGWSEATPAAVFAEWRATHSWGPARRTSAWREKYAQVLDPSARAKLLASAEDILAGRFVLFSWHRVETGFPPRWLVNPMTPQSGSPPAGVHWSQVSMRGDSYGELKFVWELSRASWAFTLGRAYAATGDERFAEGFWRLWLDWIESNPPNSTAQWKDGQECAFRIMATTFAVAVCAPAAATTAERFVRHLGTVGALADRIHRGRTYAQLQDNNHSMSEAAGIYTAGVQYPLLRDADGWRRGGWQRLCDEAMRLIRPDGGFTQKSHNYHRVMLHDYLWAASMADTTGERFPPAVQARLEEAADYLDAIVDRDSGQAPNFGANDGALVLPLEEAPYTDFRPTLAAARYLAHGVRPATGRPGEETLLWLFGMPAQSVTVDAAGPAPAVALARSGIYTLHQEHSWIFCHAERFVDRPGQADQLHLDLWWRGLNMARDAGSYLYFAAPELYSWFRGSRCHNTVTVDGLDQMEPGPRFLWASRANASAQLERNSVSAGVSSLRLTHDGYHRLPSPVSHERRVHPLANDRWLIVDSLSSAGAHRYTLHWLLPDCPFRREAADLVIVDTPHGPYYLQLAVTTAEPAEWSVHRAEEGQPAWGWESRFYGLRTPALSVVMETQGSSVQFVSLFTPHPPDRPLAAWLGRLTAEGGVS
jgi:hypothetical protein